MDMKKVEAKLTEYKAKLEAYLQLGLGPRGLHPDNAQREELRQLEPTIKQILTVLNPKLDFDFEALAGEQDARNAVDRALGILRDREEWAEMLAPDAPSLPADQFHPWIWNAAASLWEAKHYRQAVQAAATALNAHTQNKLNRRDLSDTKLMQAIFSAAPKPGQPCLTVETTGMSGETANGMQTGVLQFAVGCFQAIRNPATHEAGPDWDSQIALEYLAALSVLARWIDKAAVHTP
jgi:hypothetical protein